MHCNIVALHHVHCSVPLCACVLFFSPYFYSSAMLNIEYSCSLFSLLGPSTSTIRHVDPSLRIHNPDNDSQSVYTSWFCKAKSTKLKRMAFAAVYLRLFMLYRWKPNKCLYGPWHQCQTVCGSEMMSMKMNITLLSTCSLLIMARQSGVTCWWCLLR